MSADIVERLEDESRKSWQGTIAPMLREAAAEIVRLRGEVADVGTDAECQIHREAHHRIDSIVMGAGAFDVVAEGGVAEAWENTIAAVSKLSTIAPAEAKGDAFRYPPTLDRDEDGDPIYSFPLGPYRVSIVGHGNKLSVIATEGSHIAYTGEDVPFTPQPAGGEAVAWVEIGQFCLGRPEEWELRSKQREEEDQPLYTTPPAALVQRDTGISAAVDRGDLRNTFAPAGDALGAVRDALEWYAEQVAGCRKLGSAGDPYRHALDSDGGKRARDALRPSAGEGKGVGRG